MSNVIWSYGTESNAISFILHQNWSHSVVIKKTLIMYTFKVEEADGDYRTSLLPEYINFCENNL